MTQSNFAWLAPIKVSTLKPNKPRKILIEPDAQTCVALAKDLDLLGLKKLRLTGVLEAQGKNDWRLVGTLGATVTQPCTISLLPVTTRIDTNVERTFLAQMAEYEAGSENEMPEDDTTEPLGDVIDPGHIMAEALALALPDYPRAPDAELENAQFAAPGVTPMSDQDARPFAALAGLRETLEKKAEE